MTVPGVGPVAALSYKVGVDDPWRFARSRTVGEHFGLAPRRQQSGTSIDYEGRISNLGDVAVHEPAASLLLRVRTWSAPRAWGLRIAKRSSMLCAITAVARKLRKHSAPNVGQRDRFPRWFWRQSHAAAAVETCTVAAVRATTD
ncbi:MULTISPECIES: transposase [unclassified Bradyrhizobium]|uniref:transposase n=1 Tax=Bradyrhizobium sp. USDA 4541 TaxID=2817704 RepID=UPI0020A36781|nr:transposase [Bradyrhizobium sp. USDA 4541]MCP1854264.1 transposase [Bradyrhizobium sp. USDA 4541]